MPAYYRILNHTKKEYFDLEALRAANGNALSGVGEGLLVSWPFLLLSEPGMDFFLHNFQMEARGRALGGRRVARRVVRDGLPPRRRQLARAEAEHRHVVHPRAVAVLAAEEVRLAGNRAELVRRARARRVAQRELCPAGAQHLRGLRDEHCRAREEHGAASAMSTRAADAAPGLLARRACSK